MEKILGQHDRDFLSASRRDHASAQEASLIARGQVQCSDESFVRDGLATSYLSSRFPVLDGNRQMVAIGLIAMEIGDEQRHVADAERALKAAQQANSRLRSAIFSLEKLASTDRLTSAWNRRRFEETIDGETHRSARYGHPLSMLLLDIDHFKRINDTHGHTEGDRVLVEVSTQVRAIMRRSDSLTRWGGEEFIVLMPNTGLERAMAMAERIRETVAAGEVEGIGRLTVSIGVAEYLPSERAPEWLDRTDRAMYRAKNEGRNRVVADPLIAPRSTRAGAEGSFVQLVWKDAFLCGHPQIDEQHQMLFRRANELIEMLLSGGPAQQLMDAIDGLLQEVGEHFRDEERILRALGFARLDAHSAEHASLLGRCRDLLAEMREGRLAVGEMFHFLAYELVTRHLMGADREYFALTAEPAET